MFITTKLVLSIADGKILYQEGFEYEGPVALCCGSTSAQDQSGRDAATFSKTLQSQSATVFGDSSQIFSDLTAAFAPIVAAGPNQEGFSPGEKSALNSSVIDTEGQAAKNAKAATGNAIASVGGGNTNLPSGSAAGIEAGTETAFGEKTAAGLQDVTKADYATGRQNFNEAAGVLGGAPGVFNASSNASGEANTSIKNSADIQNQIAQAENSWMTPVAGILGGVASKFTGGLTGGGGQGTMPGPDG